MPSNRDRLSRLLGMFLKARNDGPERCFRNGRELPETFKANGAPMELQWGGNGEKANLGEFCYFSFFYYCSTLDT